MATTATKRKLFESEKRLIMMIQINSDTTSELTDEVLVDFSADVTISPRHYTAPTSLKVDRIQIAGASGWQGRLEFDATTDVPFFTFDVGNSPIDFDFGEFGGIPDNKASGFTGDILLTTTGVTANESATIILHMSKR